MPNVPYTFSRFILLTVKNLTSEKTCLHILAEKGQRELAEMLLERLTSATRRSDLLNAVVLTELEGQRPRHLASIHLASLKGHTDLVELFLDQGVDVNWTNNKNDTPVLWAARGNHIDTVRLLISRGANLHLENDKGSTPLYWAVRYGFVDLVRLLVAEGHANVQQRRKLGLVTPIVLASALGHRDIVEVLLDYGANVTARVGNGMTALHVAAFEVILKFAHGLIIAIGRVSFRAYITEEREYALILAAATQLRAAIVAYAS
jgi:ankyrin repeat protein